jgi:alcohol dehydrogenase
MLNSWELIGQFMYSADAPLRLLDLIRSGLLDIRKIRPRIYPLAALPEAMEVAARAGNFETIVVQPGG